MNEAFADACVCFCVSYASLCCDKKKIDHKPVEERFLLAYSLRGAVHRDEAANHTPVTERSRK